jgi:hypothetical protein
MVARTEAVPVVTKWHWMPLDPFGDLRVRYGIKMGLAGLLALFCTQVLRLPHDNWAILTVLVLMSAQFVGSITVKAIMRVIGTIVGALVGIWLVGYYTSTPAIFLPVLFLVIALASYQFGQLGARQVPYAFFCSASPRLPSLPMGSRSQHKHGRSASIDRRRFWSES